MFDGNDLNRSRKFMKKETVIANPKSELWGIDTLKPLHVPFLRRGELGKRLQYPQRGHLVDRADLRLRPCTPDDSLAQV